MNYRIEQKEPFNIVGIMKRVPIIFEGENPEITAMWKSLTREKIEQLKELSNVEPGGIIQASSNYQVAEGPEILSIKTKDLTSPSVKSEVWVPVEKVN